MSAATSLPGVQGAIVWAISPFENEAPFQLLRPDGSTRTYRTASELSQAVLEHEEAPEFDLVLPAKVRPVVLLQDRPLGRYPEFAALKLTRLEKFAPHEQDAIRRQTEADLFYLGRSPEEYGLPKEHAIDLNALVRVHRSAIAGKPVGRLDAAEFRAVSERVVRVIDLDLANLVVREAGGLLRRLEEGRSG